MNDPTLYRYLEQIQHTNVVYKIKDQKVK